MRRFCAVIISMFIWLATLGAWAEEARHGDHEILRGLLKVTRQAFNTKNFDLLKEHIAPDHFAVITIDGNKFNSLESFRKYWDDVLKKNKTGLERIEVNPVADGPTEFLADTVGICHGVSNDRYYFTNGDIRTMLERWTAVMLKEGGDWKIARIVFSANILNNPVLTGTREVMQNLIILAGLAGLAAGALGMWLFRLRKTA